MPKEIYIDENGNENILSSSPSGLSGLIDTDISSATQGEVLAVDSNGKWANTAPKTFHSVVAGSAISTQDTYQIPNDYLTKSDVIIIEAHRYSEGGSMIVPVSFITSGYYSAGFYIRASKNNGWTFTVSTSGEIALLFKDGTAGDPVMSIGGWW